MDILFGTNVDLITPFPEAEISRIWPWMQCFQSLVFHDHSANREEYEDYFRSVSRQGLSYGIIDKNNITKSNKVDTPIIGVCFLEPGTPTNFYGHIAASRKAGRSYKLYGVSMMDEAVEMVSAYAFQTYPSLQRLSTLVLESNRPVRSLMGRTGFQQDGQFENWFTQSGEPRTACHYGKLRGV